MEQQQQLQAQQLTTLVAVAEVLAFQHDQGQL
jgi:hypothetical protein